MNRNLQLAAARPDMPRIAQQEFRVYVSGDQVETPAGLTPVSRLRPGDRIRSDGQHVVLWVSMSRKTPSTVPVFRIVLGDASQRDESKPSLPVGGRVSARTGKLELHPRTNPHTINAQRLH